MRPRTVANHSTYGWHKAIRATVEPGTLVLTDGLSAYQSALADCRHEVCIESAPGAADPHVLLPGVHRVSPLAERWLLGTHQASANRAHLPEYLDEFAFRWNCRHARNRDMVFFRLLQHTLDAVPVSCQNLVCVGVAKPITPRPQASAD